MKAMPDGPRIEDKIVGANLRRVRLQRGWSQTDLANKLGLTFQQVQKYEKGTNRISASRCVMVCRVLKTNLGELFKGIEFVGDKEQKDQPMVMLMKNKKMTDFLKLAAELPERDLGIVMGVCIKLAKSTLGR
jgi:transcriptional regulator with XRE-family HTH domain